MTEKSYQEARKVMQRANYLRGIITKAKGEVSKWTSVEMGHRESLQVNRADAAKKTLEKAMLRLKLVREMFQELKFPPK